MAEEIRLESDNILSLLVRLSIPGIVSMFIQALYNVVDSIWIGRLSKEALAALSLAFPVQIILIAIAVGTGIGVTSLISRLIGQGELKKASNTAEHGLVIALIYGGMGLVVGFFFSEDILSLFTNDSLLIQLGSQYIKIILMGSTALSIPVIANTILRGEGNTFIPMITMLIGSVLNMVLDPFFIFGLWVFPRWEIEGAAFATVLSRIISGTFILYILFKGDNLIKLNLKDFKPNFSLVKGIYAVGFPSMVMQLIASFMIASVNTILAGYSSVAIAAMGIYFRLQSFVLMPVYGLNQGYMPIIGYNYGHKKPERIKKTIVYGFVIAFVFTMIGFFIFQVFPQQLVRLFNESEELITIGTSALKTISYLYPVVGFSIIASVTFQAFGKGFRSLAISVLRQVILILPLAYLFGRIGGLSLLWYAFPVAEIVAFIFIMIWFKTTLKEIELEIQKP
ncbi:MAG: MATE family efflux transporter [Theionarchaea archaeon]|nr:MATE family efflux transporter [Theionarchaea archaeon]